MKFLQKSKNNLGLTWQNVLDSRAPNRTWAGHIDNYLPTVDKAGYDYFSWNNRIYHLERHNNGELNYSDTKLTVKDLE